MPTVQLLSFISRVSPDQYHFIITPEGYVYGGLVSDELVEYLLAEHTIEQYITVSKSVLIKIGQQPGYKTCGDIEIMY